MNASTTASALRSAQLFRQAFAVQVLNPKTAVFFLAFLPQFVDVDNGAVTTQVLVLGTLGDVRVARLGRRKVKEPLRRRGGS